MRKVVLGANTSFYSLDDNLKKGVVPALFRIISCGLLNLIYIISFILDHVSCRIVDRFTGDLL